MQNLFPVVKPTWLLLLEVVLLSSCRKDALAPANLVGEWQVVSIREFNALSPQTVDKPYQLEFKSDGSFSFQRDVNLCYGEYLVPEPGQISMVGISCTEICCDSKMAVATTWLFSETTTYSIKKKILTLAGDGEIKLEKVK